MVNVNNNYTDMKNLTPFKLCVLQNFPFIEADFDAVTNYQLLCKVVEYLNNVIDNNNKQNNNITQLEQNFITLYNYVKDYFDNLDVQDEINNKLDEMADDGTLANIINKNIFSDLKKRTFFLFGDSFFDGYDPDSTERKGWGYWLKTWLENKGYIVHLATDITTTPYGSAFGGDKTYVMHLNASIEAHPEYLDENITDIIVYTGTNDSKLPLSETENGINSFVQEIKKYWQYASIKIGFISTLHDINARNVDSLFRDKCGIYGCSYIKNGYGLCTHKNLLSSDGTHLTTEGYRYYAPFLAEGALSNNIHYIFSWTDLAINSDSGLIFKDVGFNMYIKDNSLFFKIANVGNGIGTIKTSNLSGTNPAIISASFDNPTLIDLSTIVTRSPVLSRYSVESGNYLGSIEYYIGGYLSNNSNLVFKVLGSIENSQSDVYSELYTEVVLN